jgi:hypothetical protein
MVEGGGTRSSLARHWLSQSLPSLLWSSSWSLLAGLERGAGKQFLSCIVHYYHHITTSPLSPYRPWLVVVAGGAGLRGAVSSLYPPCETGTHKRWMCGGCGRIWLFPSATGGGFHPVGVLRVSGGRWLTGSHVPRGFPAAWASQCLLIIVPPPHRRLSPSNRPHIPFGRGGGHRHVMGPSWERTCLKTRQGENGIVVS